MIFTSTSTTRYQKIIRENKTLKAQVLAALRIAGHTSYELEEGLNRLHQSVSSTLTRLEQDGVVEVKSHRNNQYNNSCGVYSLKGPERVTVSFKAVV